MKNSIEKSENFIHRIISETRQSLEEQLTTE